MYVWISQIDYHRMFNVNTLSVGTNAVKSDFWLHNHFFVNCQMVLVLHPTSSETNPYIIVQLCVLCLFVWMHRIETFFLSVFHLQITMHVVWFVHLYTVFLCVKVTLAWCINRCNFKYFLRRLCKNQTRIVHIRVHLGLIFFLYCVDICWAIYETAAVPYSHSIPSVIICCSTYIFSFRNWNQVWALSIVGTINKMS